MNQSVKIYDNLLEKNVQRRAVAQTSSDTNAKAALPVEAQRPPLEITTTVYGMLAISWPSLATAVETPSGVALGLPTNHAPRAYTGEVIQFGKRSANGVVFPVSLMDCQLMQAELYDGENERFLPGVAGDQCFRFQISVGLSFHCASFQHG